jgi:nitroimidazol reductase NimA-like FMN-containing flavoprotein (pyridoxamine 5'-phosphate oxidase superfamily)
MRRAEKEIHDERLINEILTRAKLCHLSFHDEPYPYAITVNYGVKDGYLYFHSAPEGKKIDLLLRNPHICFQVMTDVRMTTGNDPCSDWTMKYKSITGFGKAEILTEITEKIAGLNILMAHYSSKGPFTFSEKNLAGTAVIKIRIDSLTAKASEG